LRHSTNIRLKINKNFTKYCVTCFGIYLNNYAAKTCGLPLYLLYGTNCTISLGHLNPLDPNKPLSPSSYSMFPNEALPIPTMITDVGKFELLTIISLVAAIS